MFSRLNQFHFKVYLDKLDTEGGTAKGDLFWDDGVSIGLYESIVNHYLYLAAR